MKFITDLKLFKSVKVYFFYFLTGIFLQISGNCLFAKVDTLDLSNPELYQAKIALALSGGGARGISQIGVLEKFEQEGIKINSIVGTSIGAIIGGLYASGYSARELDSIVNANDWNETFAIANDEERSNLLFDQKLVHDRNLLTLQFSHFNFVAPKAVSFGEQFDSFVLKLFLNARYHPSKNFDDLKYRFRAVATDLNAGKSVTFDKGNIIEIVRASATIPLRFQPVKCDSMFLVDGGILANLPVRQTRSLQPDLTIAVNTTSDLLKSNELDNVLTIADQIISVSMIKFAKEDAEQADFEIKPNIGDYKNTDFSNLDSLVKSGEKAASLSVDLIKMKADSISDVKFEKFLDDFSGNINNLAVEGFCAEDSVKLNRIVKDFSINNVRDLRNFILNALNTKYYSIKMYNRFPGYAQPYIKAESGRIQHIRIDFANVGGSPEFEDYLNNSFNDVFYTKSFLNKIDEQILTYLRNKGFSFAYIKSEKFNSGILNISINPGYISHITTDNPDGVGKFLIDRELTIKKGDILRADDIVKSWRNLSSTGYFESINIVPAKDSSGNKVKLSIRESPNQTLKFGVRVDDERNTQAGVDAIQDNLFNVGGSVDIRFAGGEYNQHYSLRLEYSRIFESNYLNYLTGYYTTRDVYTYSPVTGLPTDRFDTKRDFGMVEERYGVRTMVGTQIEKIGRFGFEYRFEKQRFYEMGVMVKPNYYTISTLKISSVFDGENKSDFPTSGRVIDLSLETGFFEPQNGISFSKAVFNYRNNITFGRNTFRPSLQFGMGDATLPYPEFFSLGGEESFFGYGEDELRGRQALEASLEYRYHSPVAILFDTYFMLRYDVGSVWEVPEQIKFSSFKHGIGFTIAMDTPLGPGKFSVGRAFYFLKEPAGAVWGPYRLYFSIGLKL